MSLTAGPEPSEPTRLPAYQAVTLKACESGRQNNKTMLCAAAHLGSNQGKEISVSHTWGMSWEAGYKQIHVAYSLTLEDAPVGLQIVTDIMRLLLFNAEI